jgi:hypothetical protein
VNEQQSLNLTVEGSLMKYKLIAFFAGLVLFSQALMAESITVHGIHGSWWNPQYAGEGFTLEQYEDGLVIGYWYTYDMDGNQVWLIGTGTMDGSHVTLEMTQTGGGQMGSPRNPGDVTEIPWGTVSLDLVDCDTIDMNYSGDDGSAGGYRIERIVKDPLRSTACEVVDEDVVDLGFKLQQKDAFGNWDDRRIPFAGTHTVSRGFSGDDDRITLYRMRLVSTSGDFTISRVQAWDSTGVTSPSIVGLFANQTLREGTPIEFQMKATKTYGAAASIIYQVQLLQFGDVINLNVNLKTN